MPWDSAMTSEPFAALFAGDGEFRIAARFWTGGLRLEQPDAAIGVTLDDGDVRAATPAKAATAAVPPRLCNDVSLMVGARRMELDADRVLFAQYYPAVARAIELLRPAAPQPATPPAKPVGAYDAPVGRYVHLELEGQDHRVYFEEAGQGVPMLLQHTAGCHGAQWRHLMECTAITDHFRLIAYDLPFHGKSLPPTGPRWWASEYRLTGEALREVPLGLAAALGLERPVFMGCSVGGLLALD